MNLGISTAYVRRLLGEIAPMLVAAPFLVALAALILYAATDQQPAAAPSLWDDYTKAVREAMQPNAASASHTLFPIKPGQPVTVVTWTNHQYVSSYQKATQAPVDVWVTAAPFLKAFCQQFVKEHGSDPERLSLRLKQRLGLPPDGENDTFVELRVDPANPHLFRPCGDPSVSTDTCAPPSLPGASGAWKLNQVATWNEQQTEWMLRNYYSTYSSAKQYPWTLLGYTFDWSKDDGGNFVRTGESEFVIPKDQPVQFVSAADTGSYCKP